MEQKKASKRSNREKRRLRQLIVCLVLFGMIFAGRGLDLEPVERAAAAVSRWVGADTDFQAVFARMGESFSRGEPAMQTFHVLWDGLIPGGEEKEGREDEPRGEESVKETGLTSDG